MVKISLRKADLSGLRDAARQAEFMQRAVERRRVERRARLGELESAASAVAHAARAYESLDLDSVPTVRLRDGLVYLDPARSPGGLPDRDEDAQPLGRAERLRIDVASRPLLTRLTVRRSRSVSLLLTAVYVTHVETAPKASVINRHGVSNQPPGMQRYSWATLAGMGGYGHARARRARVTRALDELHRARLVTLGAGAERYEGFRLLREDGTEKAYLVPGEDASNVLAVPTAFFHHGWHLVLQPKEIATYLAVRDAVRRLTSRLRADETGVALPQMVRDTRYGLSGEAYESVHELAEFGLLRIIDPMPTRRRGKFRPTAAAAADPDDTFRPLPYRFELTDAALDRSAVEVVEGALRATPTPPRFDDLARLSGAPTFAPS